MSEKSSGAKDTMEFLVSGLVALVVGIGILTPGLLGYWHSMEEFRDSKERAQEMGLDEFPGVTAKDTAWIFSIIIVIGGFVAAAGCVLISVAFLKNKRAKAATSDGDKIRRRI